MENKLKLSDPSIMESDVVSIMTEIGSDTFAEDGVAITVAFKDFSDNIMAYEEILLTKADIVKLYKKTQSL